MLRNLSLTLIAVAVLSACGSSGGGSGLGTSLAGAKSLAGANQTDSGAGNADDGASGDSGASLVAPNKNNTNNQKPNPTPTPQDPIPSKLMSFSKTTWIGGRGSSYTSRYLQELTIDGKTYRYQNKETSVDDDTINLAELGMGFSTRQVEYSITPTVDSYSINLAPSKKDTAKGILTVYQRPYSVVHSLALPKYYGSDGQFDTGCGTDATAASCKLDDGIINTFGHLTPTYVIDNFAGNNQKFSYSGEAFTVAPVPERGVFKYQVNFGTDNSGFPDATSSGSITGFNSVGDITLGSSQLGFARSISGTATESKNGRIGDYTLNFFGPNAEEVAGKGIIRDTGKDANGIPTNTIFGFSGVR